MLEINIKPYWLLFFILGFIILAISGAMYRDNLNTTRFRECVQNGGSFSSHEDGKFSCIKSQ